MQSKLPFARNSKTSQRAAREMQSQPAKLRRDHESILNVLLSGPKTDRELQDILNMSGDSERPRRIELVKLGRVVDTGRTRNRSTLWRRS